MKALILPVLAMFLMSSVVQTATADGCRRVVTHQQIVVAHHQPQIVVDHFQQHHNFHDTIIVPKAFRVLINQDAYTTVADEYRQTIFARLVAEEFIKLQGRAGVDPSVPAAAPTPKPAAAPIPDLTPAIEKYLREREALKDKQALTAEQPKAQTKTNVEPKLVALMAAKCVSCHAGGANGINLSEENLGVVPEASRWKSFGFVNSGHMPKKKEHRLTDEEVQTVYNWAASAYETNTGVKPKQ